MAISFSITSPAVIVGDIHPESSSAPLDPKALDAMARLTGMPFDNQGSPQKIAAEIGNVYQEQGYLEAHVGVMRQPDTAVRPDAIRIPFSISVAPGQVYKLGAIRLEPGTVVSQAEFDKQSQIRPGDIANGTRVRQNWDYLSRQYHNHGYVTARVQPTPKFDRSMGTVSYDVTVDPGPVYTMGALTIENVSDDMRAQILAAWKMPEGAVFNEGTIRGFFATHDVNPKLERVFTAVNVSYALHLNDGPKTVDVVLRLQKKP